MDRDPKVLIIGNSHVVCIQRALALRKDPNVKCSHFRISSDEQVTSVPDLVDAVKEMNFDTPDVICLCIVGNQHNSLGLFESPRPFSIGADKTGEEGLNDPSRAFIPFNVMVDHLYHNFRPEFIAGLFDAFPDSVRMYINAPPPIGDWGHILANLGPFVDRIKDEPAPKALRQQLYLAQTVALQRIADHCKASFLIPPANTMDDDGFLLAEFFGKDPTHANTAYGNIMCDALISLAKNICASRGI